MFRLTFFFSILLTIQNFAWSNLDNSNYHTQVLSGIQDSLTMPKFQLYHTYPHVKTQFNPILLSKPTILNNAVLPSIDKLPFIAILYKQFFNPIRLPDSILFTTYFYQSLNLTSFLFPLFFYDPRIREEEFNYFLTSGIFALGLLPVQYATKPVISYLKNVFSIPTPQIYLYGVLGSLTGLTIPLIFKSDCASVSQMFTPKTFTNALGGYLAGIIMAFAFNSRCQFTYQQSSIVCMYSLSGIISGAFLGQFFNGNANRNTLSGILLGGWSGLILGIVFDQITGNYSQFKNNMLFAELSLPAITAIPIIVALKGNSQIKKNYSVSLMEFNFRF